eukprot:jgi/Psemu1/301338/fgenesh1_kg.31_\
MGMDALRTREEVLHGMAFGTESPAEFLVSSCLGRVRQTKNAFVIHKHVSLAIAMHFVKNLNWIE